MLKKILSGTLASILVIGLSGCAQSEIQVKSMSNISVPDKTKILKLNFPEVDPISGKKLTFDIDNYNYNLQNQIIKFSKYSKFHSIDIYNSKGLKVQKDSNKYIVDYSCGTYNRIWYLNSAKFTIYLKKLTKSEISLTLDKKYTYQPSADNFNVFSMGSLDSLENLEKDSKNILSKLSTLQITLNKRYFFTGDINSKYNADSIYANFKRLAGTYNWNSYYSHSNEMLTEVKKENTFNLKVNGVSIPLHVEVYPYRNGSKVKYKAYIPYTISSNGNVSLNSNDIEKLKIEITKIIND